MRSYAMRCRDSPRQMIDKRQSRRVNRRSFVAAIAAWNERHPKAAAAAREPLSARPPAQPKSRQRVRVLARKRPLFEHETERGEFDIVSALPGSQQMAVHACCMHPDLRGMFIRHHEFGVCEAFDATEATEHSIA